MNPPLGIIEGFYGRPWSDAARRETISALAPAGYRFYLYAPKADAFLRKRWREDHPTVAMAALEGLSAHCRRLGVRFGVGLSPFEIYRDFDGGAKEALARKLKALDALGIDDLAILFDDMRGDLPGLARTQAAVVHWITERTRAQRVIACPTYYSDDPMLDRAFGNRPEGYVETLGATLDPAIAVFWTGEEVCSREFGPAHLDRVAAQLRRKPFLWDNYPVNDGPTMSPFLHLRGVTGRPARIGACLAAHAVNPALQPVLTRIPMLTLAESYAMGSDYAYGDALRRAAAQVLGEDLGARVVRDLAFFQDLGLDRLGEAAPRLRERYARFDHEGAREIVAWLDGAWRVTREMLDD